ncbi:Uncharacterised protein [Mycobacteroides abscessus subsp. abscessus]|nr:Uncharacterised protein [Mycobacteroides abscessus subsp. abscessus]
MNSTVNALMRAAISSASVKASPLSSVLSAGSMDVSGSVVVSWLGVLALGLVGLMRSGAGASSTLR